MSHLYRRAGRLVALVGLCLAGSSSAGWAYSAPDSFSNPEPISTTSDNSRQAQTYSTTFVFPGGPQDVPGTTEPGEPVSYTDGGGRTITLTSTSWYRLSPPFATGELQLSYGANNGDSPVLRLFRQDGGSGFASLTFLDADTVRSNPNAQLLFTPTAGQVYFVQLGDTSGTSVGSLTLGRSNGQPLALDNDAFADPVVITANGSSTPYTTAEASIENLEPAPGGQQIATSRWFRFTAPAGGGDVTVAITEDGGQNNARFAVYRASTSPPAINGLSQVGSGNAFTPVTVTTTGGETYYAQIGTPEGQGGLARLATLPEAQRQAVQARLAGSGNGPLAPMAAPTIASGTISVTPADAPLPVELSGFSGSARNGAVQLSWQTATERDNAGFSVIRDGVEIASFRSTQTLVGNGTASSPKAYAYTDARVVMGRSYSYTLRSTDRSGEVHSYDRSVSVELTAASLPTAFALSPASPNPFNPSTTLSLSLPEAAQVTAEVFNALGQRVAVLTAGAMSAGTHPLVWSAADQASGLYVVRVTAQTAQGRSVETQRVTLTR